MGYGKEVDMIAPARELGLLTCPYVFNAGGSRGRWPRPAPTC